MSKKISIKFRGGQNGFSSGSRMNSSVLLENSARNSSTALSELAKISKDEPVTTEYA